MRSPRCSVGRRRRNPCRPCTRPPAATRCTRRARPPPPRRRRAALQCRPRSATRSAGGSSARSPGALEAIRVGAIVGREFDAGRVATATGEPALAASPDLDEAIDAGLVEPAEGGGRFRFVHALVRDAVEATMGAARSRPATGSWPRRSSHLRRHRRRGLPELARHWSVAAALGEREVAAGWCERAADVADRRHGVGGGGPVVRPCRRLGGNGGLDARPSTGGRSARPGRGSSATRWWSRSRCASWPPMPVRGPVAPTSAAEATLLAEGRALEMLPLRDVADDRPRRHRGRRPRPLGPGSTACSPPSPSTSIPASMLTHCELAEAEAAVAGDPLADLAAVRARHNVSYGPEHAALRLDLAARLGHVARSIRRPSVGDLGSVVAHRRPRRTGPAAGSGRRGHRCSPARSTRLGMPIFHWHLAQGGGRAGAGDRPVRRRAASRRAGAAPVRHARGAARGRGDVPRFPHARGDALRMDRRARRAVGVRRPVVGPAVPRATSRSSARRRPWRGSATRIGAGGTTTGAGRPTGGIRRRQSGSTSMRSGSRSPRCWDDATTSAHLVAALEPHRGRHVGTGGGVVSYLGPVELWLGVGAAALEDWEAADRDLTTAARLAHEAGTPSFVVHADVERAEALLGRAADGDQSTARGLLAGSRAVAERLGMRGFVEPDRRRPRRLQR